MLKLTTSTNPIELPTTLSDNAVAELESALASYLGYEEIIALNSAESAFSLALSPLEKERSVLCSPNAPIALFNTLTHQNLHTEYADLKLDGTMYPRFFHKSKTEQTSALVLSHNHGILSDCKETAHFTQENNLTFIEDATQAFSKRAKSGAELVVYSLDTLVSSSIANGAFIATDNTNLAKTVRTKAQGGFEQKKFWNYDLVSTNPDLSLSALTAQFALEALKDFDQKEARIKEIQNTFLNSLSSNRLIELPTGADLMAYPLFQIALVPALFCPKEDIYQALVEAGIPVEVGNKPIYKTTTFLDSSLSLFGAEEVFKAQLLLPCHHFMTDEDVTFVINTLEKVLETHGYRGCSF